jgi:hypothetical protein
MKKHELQSVAEAEATLRALEAKQIELQAVAEQLAVAKKAAFFAAHTGASDHKLVDAVRAIRENAADIESIGEAVAEAKNRITIARVEFTVAPGC